MGAGGVTITRSQREAVKMLRLRTESGLTVNALAELAGVSPTTIKNAERGKSALSDRSAERIARALGVAPQDIIERPGQFRPADGDSQLRRLRHDMKLSSREAAERIGVSRSALLRAEVGEQVGLRNAKLIANFFGVAVADVWKRPKAIAN